MNKDKSFYIFLLLIAFAAMLSFSPFIMFKVIDLIPIQLFHIETIFYVLAYMLLVYVIILVFIEITKQK